MILFKNFIGRNLIYSLKNRRDFSVNQLKLASSQLPTQKESPINDLMVEIEIPVERRSLTRGLSLNKFEKVNISNYKYF